MNPARIAISTLGTRGDVQPYVALSVALMARGHQVQLAAPAQFEGFVREHGIASAPLPAEFLDLVNTPEGKAAVAGSKGFGAGFKLLKYMRPLGRRLLDTEWEANRSFSPDLLIQHPKSFGTPHMAEALGVPSILASPLPGFTPTAAFPSPIVPFRTLGPLNGLTHSLTRKAPELLFGRTLKEWRIETLRRPARPASRLRPDRTIYAYSPHVVPVPPEWGDDVLVSGYWFLDSGDWAPGAALQAFLEGGEPPVYFGFGSMPGIEPEARTSVIVEALRRTGKRGLLATIGGALATASESDHVHVIESAPHDKLFAYVAATVHHGGAGTTGAALRAGKPTTICPFLGDQPFWARRVVDLGVGPPALDRNRFSVESVVECLNAMDEPAMRNRAARLGEAIRREDGVGTAVGFIEDLLSSVPGRA
jgi:sterol 3beta-glucosyltransferase